MSLKPQNRNAAWDSVETMSEIITAYAGIPTMHRGVLLDTCKEKF